MVEPINGEVVVRKGTTVSLECKANGNPTPTVSWVKLTGSRRNSSPGMAGGSLTNNGMILTLDNVDRKDAGRYQCTASNDVGRDAVERLNLKVLCE